MDKRHICIIIKFQSYYFIKEIKESVFFSADSKWEELHPGGERPPALQEHSAVAYKDCLYVFGGELGFSAGTETPLWVYNVKVIQSFGNCTSW